MNDAPETRQHNINDLEHQAKARWIKEELIKEHNLEEAKEDYILMHCNIIGFITLLLVGRMMYE